MDAKYVEAEDALYLRFSDNPVVESEEVQPGIVFDYDEQGRIVAVEFLGATKLLAEGAALKPTIAA